MVKTGEYVVVYDISDNSERRRIDKVLKGFGFRIQKSVFECRMTKKGKKDLIEQLEKLEIETGFVKIYREEYSSESCTVGKKPERTPDDGNVFVVVTIKILKN